MSNKTTLQDNNLELSIILGDINALPNAGGGGGAPTLVTVRVGNYLSYDCRVVYTTYTEGGGMATITADLEPSEYDLVCVDKTPLTIVPIDADCTLSSNHSAGKFDQICSLPWAYIFSINSSLDADWVTGADAYIDIS